MTTVMKFNSMITGKFKVINKNEFAGDVSFITPMNNDQFHWVLIKKFDVTDAVKDAINVMNEIISFIRNDFPDRGIFIVCNLNEIDKYENLGFTCWRDIKNPFEARPITKKIMVHISSLSKAWGEARNSGIDDLNEIFNILTY